MPWPDDDVSHRAEGWRLGFGIVMIAVTSALVIVSAVLNVTRRRIGLMKLRSLPYTLTGMLACVMDLFTPVQEVIGVRRFPCHIYYFAITLFPVVFTCAVYGHAFQLRTRFALEARKRRLAKVELAALDTADFERLKARISTEHSLIFVAAKLLPYLALDIGLLFLVKGSTWGSDNLLTCPSDTRTLVMNYLTFAVEIPLGLWFIQQLRGTADAIGFRDELKRNMVMGVTLFGGFFLQRFTLGDEEHKHFERGYFPVWFLQYWLVDSALLPPLRTYPWFVAWERSAGRRWASFCGRCCCCGCGRRLCCAGGQGRGVGDQTTASEQTELAALVESQRASGNTTDALWTILRNQRAFSFFMVHMQREFCEETLLCVKAIEMFKRAPDVNKLTDVFTKYVMPGAPLQVNVSHEVVEGLEHAINHPELLVIPAAPSRAVRAAAAAAGQQHGHGQAQAQGGLSSSHGHSGDFLTLDPALLGAKTRSARAGSQESAGSASGSGSLPVPEGMMRLEDVLNTLQIAMLQILRNDSLPRFLQSSLWRDLQLGKLPPSLMGSTDDNSLTAMPSVNAPSKYASAAGPRSVAGNFLAGVHDPPSVRPGAGSMLSGGSGHGGGNNGSPMGSPAHRTGSQGAAAAATGGGSPAHGGGARTHVRRSSSRGGALGSLPGMLPAEDGDGDGGDDADYVPVSQGKTLSRNRSGHRPVADESAVLAVSPAGGGMAGGAHLVPESELGGGSVNTHVHMLSPHSRSARTSSTQVSAQPATPLVLPLPAASASAGVGGASGSASPAVAPARPLPPPVAAGSSAAFRHTIAQQQALARSMPARLSTDSPATGSGESTPH